MRTNRLILKQYITEVLAGFGIMSPGAGNLRPDSVAAGTVGTGAEQNGNILSDEDIDETEKKQDMKQAACCLVLSNDGLVLAVSRKDAPDQLGFPGGKVDPGESVEDAAKRELEEECGLVATKLTQVFVQTDSQGFKTTTFACEVKGQINTNEAGVVRWVHPSVLTSEESSPFVDYNRAIFKKLGIRF